jgi:hypothetical protein
VVQGSKRGQQIKNTETDPQERNWDTKANMLG